MFVWDLDETIIIFHSLLTGSYAQKYGKVRYLLKNKAMKIFFTRDIVALVLVWERFDFYVQLERLLSFFIFKKGV